MVPTALTVIGALALVVSVITECIKEVGELKWFPTNAVVIVLSVVLTIIAYFVYVSVQSLPVLWYGVVGAFVGGFFVAFIAMFGWEKFTELKDRFWG